MSSSDLGNDQPSAQALLSRHKVLQGELAAYEPELNSLNTQADRLIAQGIDSIQVYIYFCFALLFFLLKYKI